MMVEMMMMLMVVIKRKFGCEDEVDDGGIDDDDYGNDANVGDCLSKTDSDDDADSDGGNSNDDGDVDGNGVYNIKGGDEVNDGNAHTKSVAGDLAECNESSKMKMRVGIM